MARVGDLSPARVWEAASQRAIGAVRSGGDGRLVLVQGYEWAGAQRWPANHPTAWISEQANDLRYEAHHSTGTGTTRAATAAATAAAIAAEVVDAQHGGF